MTNDLKPEPPDNERVKAIAADVGKSLVDYIEFMYPEMVQACRSWKSAKVSLRNHVHNDIMAAVKMADQGRDEWWVKSNELHRRKLRKIRKAKTVDEVVRASRS